ncbi:MAG: DegT/DnrJ/EryC1/StrS family aminotransferase [Planctomycetaceae bacterium]|nr:DegT/DnrJ/EryC1/StrS family aminotransferase [Planctomycetota bacterium]NUN52799.1 DegT/DnrJ/EryC1/StrS family aminotransferase [Planctomycetaceae bacterium]
MSRVYLSPPHMGGEEQRLVAEAFASNWIAPLGPHVDAFEREFAPAAGRRHAAALSSGTAALHLALAILGVGPGDEVVVPTLTFIASASPVVHLGARPVLLDVDPGSWTLDPGLLDEELAEAARRGRLPKAVVPVDLYGQCADYGALVPVCERWGVPLVEDAAEALGATCGGRPAGAFGRIAIFSFNGNKIITTSGGGMLASDDPGLVARARFLSTQARDPAPHYEHSVVGFNYRMSNLLAAVGRGQLRVLPDRVAARRRNFEEYRRALGDLPGLSFMPEAPHGTGTRWLTVALVDPAAFGASREDLRLLLEEADIESRPAWKPLHLQPVFAGCRSRGGAVAEGIFERGLCLPSGSSLSDGDRERVIAILRGAARG